MDTEWFFTDRWPALRGPLTRALISAGASPSDVDDVLQETALRLYRFRSRVDPNRSVEAYARVIALNVWRGMIRQRAERETLSADLPEPEAANSDTERIGLARVELSRLAEAVHSMRPDHRDALLDGLARELTDEPANEPVPARERMARMRARRHLAACLRRTAAIVAAASLAAREFMRQGWSPPTTALAGSSAALLVALTTGPATDAPPLSTDAPKQPPTTQIAAPPATPQAVVRPEAPESRRVVRVWSDDRTGTVDQPTLRTDRPKRATRGPVRKPTGGDAIVEFESDLTGDTYGLRVYDQGPAELHICVVGATPARDEIAQCG